MPQRWPDLSLGRPPAAFLCEELRQWKMATCGDLARTRDGRRVVVPGSARGVTFVTVEDETGIANLVVWASLFEAQRLLILNASMLACHGRVQREGDVVHVIADRLEDLSDLLRSVGERADGAPIRGGRGDATPQAVRLDPRDSAVSSHKPGRGIKVPTRDFR